LPWWGHIVYQIANTHSVINNVKKDIQKKSTAGQSRVSKRRGRLLEESERRRCSRGQLSVCGLWGPGTGVEGGLKMFVKKRCISFKISSASVGAGCSASLTMLPL